MPAQASPRDAARRPRFRALALAVLPLALIACGFEPKHEDLHYSLNAATTQRLDELVANREISAATARAFRSRLEGALEMLVGDPQGPGYLLPEEWIDDGFNPAFPKYAADDDGSGEIGEELFAELIVPGNEQRFARELALIEAGDFDALGPFTTKPVLGRQWAEHLEGKDGWENQDEWLAEARAIFTDYYPQLEDSAALYRQQCLHCHGVEGGGNGPTAQFLNPLPRDYRKGVFKFTAVKDKARPRRADLYRILEEGVYSTAMPSFKRFSPAELHGLVDYVRLLAIRGEVEGQLVAIWQGNGFKLSPESILEVYTDIWGRWRAAEDAFFYYDGEVPEVTPELLARGREVYEDAARGNCLSCHGEEGRGDGTNALKFDEAGDPIMVDGRQASAYTDDWGHPIYPRNLTQGLFRGGSRPIDIYRRVYAGINGTPMPAIGESRDSNGELVMPPEDIWAVVFYVKSLSEGAWERSPLLAGRQDGHAEAGAGHGGAVHHEDSAPHTDGH